MRKKKVFYWSLGLFAALTLIYVFANGETPAEKRKREIEAQFSPIDGNHTKLTQLIKKDLPNPGSYKNIETNYSDVDTAIVVNQHFRFEDQLGTQEEGFVKALVDNKGNIKILEKR